MTSINRYRKTDQLVMYTEDYNTSTKSTNDGDEVVLDVISGEVGFTDLLSAFCDSRSEEGKFETTPICTEIHYMLISNGDINNMCEEVNYETNAI
ncbi:hypothetical protein D3C76_166370 [compost metagenome]